jgi:MFS family permease
MLRGENSSDFRRYFIGSATSDFGTWMQNTAQVLLAYQLAHSVLTVGLVTFAQFTSPLLLGPWAGVAADKFGSRRTLLVTQMVSAVVAATLAILDFAGLLNAWVLGAGAIITGLAFTFALPARNVIVQRLVPADKLKPAYAMDSVSYNLGRAVAPVVTMALGLAGITFAWAFAANAVSFVAFGVILRWWVRLGEDKDQRRPSRVRDGFAIARADKRILILLLMVAAVTVADDPILVLGPSLANQLHATANWSGWFIAALGTGTVLGSFRPSKHYPTLRLAATALAALAVCMLFFVCAPLMHVGFPPIRIGIAVAAAVGAGASCLIANSVTRAALAERAGPKSTAAVMAVWAIAWAGSKPFASLIDGWLGSWIGPQWTGVILAAPALIPFLVITLEPKVGFFVELARKWRAGQPLLPADNATGLTFGSRLSRRLYRKSLATPGTLGFHRPTSHLPVKWTDDNIANARHNRRMVDPTPTTSYEGMTGARSPLSPLAR